MAGNGTGSSAGLKDLRAKFGRTLVARAYCFSDFLYGGFERKHDLMQGLKRCTTAVN